MKNTDSKTGDLLKSPQSLAASLGEMEGEINLQWDPVNGANRYAIELSRNGIKTIWRMIDIVGSSKYTVTGLKRNKAYRFRVSALNNNHQGPWSDAVTKRL